MKIFHDRVFSFIVGLNETHPGWYELFLTLIILCCGFDLVNLTPSEAEKLDLIFPEALLITRISADLFPEETAPPLPWNKRARVSVCLVNEKFEIAESFKNHNIEGKFRSRFLLV